ncbi:MAG: hypothetical protein FRX48_01141 [Lasallia pustulata]|uniref:Uncharacterized protein n=1 Tax=Lasallia pustulata TaxID=136370 RepID=A0A5M8PZ72_9LECA|nr:MAG: hypothetical protein FRX48_01141 [Lasallia pustulata]
MAMHPLTKSATLLLLASVAAVSTWASPLAQLEDTSSLASAPYSAAAAFTSAVETRSSIATATGFQSSQADAASGLTPEAVGHEATDIVTTTFSTTAFPQCHDAFGPIAPFCQPTDGSDVYVGETYYITWDPDYFPVNSIITIDLSYVKTLTGGDNAWSSVKIPNAYGYSTLTMDKAWLQGTGRNNLTLTILSLASNRNAELVVSAGPFISLTYRPATHHPAPPTKKAPNRLGLLVGRLR